MTIGNEFELAQLRDIGRIVAVTLQRMGEALEPGMTTKELDDIGAAELARHGAISAPSKTYDFPGATCISINPAIAHGIPSERIIQAGDLINIDVSAEKDGFWADTGASFIVPPATAAKQALCRTTRKALQQALQVSPHLRSRKRAGRRHREATLFVERIPTLERLCRVGEIQSPITTGVFQSHRESSTAVWPIQRYRPPGASVLQPGR